MADRKFHYGWVVIFAAMLVMIGESFGSYVYTIPYMKEGLHLSYTKTGLLMAAHNLGYSLMVIVGGFLAVKFGARIVIALAMTIMGVATILTGFAQTFEFAVAMRTLAGLGNGAVYIPVLSLGSAWFSAKRRGLATGIIAAGIGGGTMIASSLVPVIMRAYAEGWRFAWYYQGATVLVIAGLAALLIRSMPENMGLRQVGAVEQPETDPPQNTATASLQWWKVYRTGAVWYLGLVFFWYGFSYHIFYIWFWTPNSFMEMQKVLSQGIWLPGAAGICSGMLWGGLSDKLGRGSTMALAYVVPGVCFGIFAPLQMTWGFYLWGIIIGLTASSIFTIMVATAGDYAGPRLTPAVLAFIIIFHKIGNFLGDFLGGILMLNLAPSLRPSVTPILVGCVLSLVGVVLSLRLNRIRYEES